MPAAINQVPLTANEVESARQLAANLKEHARPIGQEQADRIRVRLNVLAKSHAAGDYEKDGFYPSNLRTCAAEARRLLDRVT